MNQKLKGIYLTEKDIELMHFLHAVKIATYDQIARDIYSEYSLASVGNRLRKIEDNRLIIAERSRLLLGGKRIVHLTKNAFDDYVRKGGECILELKSEAMLHDLALVDIRSKFLKSSKTILYKTENQIQTWDHRKNQITCDAMLTANFGKAIFEIPIEYEASMKKADRYDDLIKKYYQSDHPLVIFIAETQAILNKVAETEIRLFNWDKPKIFYQLATNFLADDAMQFENCHKIHLALGC